MTFLMKQKKKLCTEDKAHEGLKKENSTSTQYYRESTFRMQMSCMQYLSYIHTMINVFQNVKVKECKRVGRRVPSSKLVREVW